MDTRSIPNLIYFAFIFFIGTYVYLSNPKKSINRYFFILSLLNSLYTFLEYSLMNTDDPVLANVILKFTSFWILIDVLQMHFILLFTKQINKKHTLWIYLSYFLGLMLMLHFILVGYNILPKRSDLIWTPLNIYNTPYFRIFLIFFQLGLSLVSIAACILHIKNSKDRKKNNQTVFMLIGVLFPVLYAAVLFDILPRLNISINIPISYSVAIGWTFIAIGIRKYNLFNITTELAAKKIISSIKDALLLINYNGIIVEANEAFYSMFQLSPLEIEDKSVDVFFKKMKVPEISLIREFKRKELTIPNIGLMLSPGRKIYMDFSTFFIGNKNGEIRGYVFLIRNSTGLIMAKQEIEKQHEEMIKMAHQAGIAEFSTSIMHNLGNVLNSVSVSSEYIIGILQNSKIPNLVKSNLLIEQNKDNVAEFIRTDPKGKVLPEYYIELGKLLSDEHKRLLSEGKRLSDRIRTMKDVIDIQQEYATTKEFYELEDVNLIIDETIQILETSINKLNVRINRLQSRSLKTKFKMQKSKLLNILLNIMKNSIDALKIQENTNRNITIRLRQDPPMFVIEISDNGIGIHPDELSNIFAFGYSNKPDGHGFGLHFCANAMKEMKGTIAVESKGLNKGAKFILSFPGNVE